MNDQQKSTQPDPKADKAPASSGSGRFAAYDETYQRYVGGVHDTKKKATDAAKARGSQDFTVREV